MNLKARPPRPQLEDYLRSVGYANFAVWAVLFFVVPPSAFVSELDLIFRLIWVSATFVGAVAALIGSLTRIDIKLEFPGLLLALIGPTFYTLSQFYLVVQPPPGADPSQRIALTAYALFGVTLLLPRAVSLLVEKNRLKGLSK